MAEVTINPDGTISVILSQNEQILAGMVLEEQGAGAFTEVFNLWFTNTVRSVMNTRFERLPIMDKMAMYSKMAQAKPEVALPADPVVPGPALGGKP